MIGGMSGVTADVTPFSTVMGNRAKLSGLNLVGLKRSGYKKDYDCIIGVSGGTDSSYLLHLFYQIRFLIH